MTTILDYYIKFKLVFFIQSGDHWMELSVRNLINILDFLLKNIGDELKKK